MKNLGSKLLVTNRLELRPQTMKEQKYLWKLLMLPEVNKYYLTVPVNLREKLKDWNIQEVFCEKSISHSSDNDVYRWSIFLKDSDICIGRISCHERSSEDEHIDNPAIRGVGWLIDPQYQNKGYATEAAIAMIDYMFEEVKIESIITSAAIENPASWKIMEKLSFKKQKEKYFVQYTYLDNLVECYKYIITKKQYEAKNRRRPNGKNN